jgi:hypothetical protein
MREDGMDDLIARIPEGFTAGPWKWWTSNSWRRLKRDDPRSTRGVAEPYVCKDGHPDLSISQEDMALIALAPELAAAVRAQAARIAELEAALAYIGHVRSGECPRDLREAAYIARRALASARKQDGGTDG